MKVAGLAGSKAPREVWLRHPLSTGSKTSTEQALMVSILYACHEGLLNKHYSYNSCSASPLGYAPSDAWNPGRVLRQKLLDANSCAQIFSMMTKSVDLAAADVPLQHLW